MKRELKSCPICKSKATFNISCEKGLVGIKCEKCFIRTKREKGKSTTNKEEFIKENAEIIDRICDEWNYRPNEELNIETSEEKKETRDMLKQISGMVSNIQNDVNRLKGEKNTPPDMFSDEEIQTIEEFEDVANYVITMKESKYATAGKTIAEIYKEDESHIIWLAGDFKAYTKMAKRDTEQIKKFVKIIKRIFP